MNNCISAEKLCLHDVNYREVRRYMHASDSDEINALIKQCIELSRNIIEPRVCFGIFDISVEDSIVKSDCFSFESSDLCVCLKNCDKLVMFCATIGFGFDRLIHKYSVSDKAKAVCLHALGSERIEALCDVFCERIADKYNNEFSLTPRFSPGYGDLNIRMQEVFFEQLSINKLLGVSLSDSYLMSPLKTVTAVFGIKNS